MLGHPWSAFKSFQLRNRMEGTGTVSGIPLIGPAWSRDHSGPITGRNYDWQPLGPGKRNHRKQRGVATTLGRQGCPAGARHRHPLRVLGKEHVQTRSGTKKAAIKSDQGGGINGTPAEEGTLHLGPAG